MARKSLKIKVCGMLYADNISAVSTLHPDYMGFIFYEKSPRYAASRLDSEKLPTLLSDEVRRTGVFVNAPIKEMLQIAEQYSLNTLQLHGTESPETCLKLRQKGYEVIKAFSVEREADLLVATLYDECCDLFLFDTRTPDHGGSGLRFDWNTLDNYNGNTPFFLSGGISALDADEVLTITHPLLYGVDLNSRFEIEAGVKNTQLLERFIKTIRTPIKHYEPHKQTL